MHLIKDFREFSGEVPTSLVSQLDKYWLVQQPVCFLRTLKLCMGQMDSRAQ